MSVGSATIASTRSDSNSQRRISDGPEPAPPVNSGEPLRTIPARPPPSETGRSFEATSWRNSICPSLMAGVPPGKRFVAPPAAISFSTAVREAFQSPP